MSRGRRRCSRSTGLPGWIAPAGPTMTFQRENQVSEAGNAIAEIKAAAPVAHVGRAAGYGGFVVTETEESSQEHTGRNRTEHDRPREPEFKIGRRLETDLLPVDRGSWRVVVSGH